MSKMPGDGTETAPAKGYKMPLLKSTRNEFLSSRTTAGSSLAGM